jgi:hypothetical protein
MIAELMIEEFVTIHTADPPALYSLQLFVKELPSMRQQSMRLAASRQMADPPDPPDSVKGWHTLLVNVQLRIVPLPENPPPR